MDVDELSISCRKKNTVTNIVDCLQLINFSKSKVE